LLSSSDLPVIGLSACSPGVTGLKLFHFVTCFFHCRPHVAHDSFVPYTHHCMFFVPLDPPPPPCFSHFRYVFFLSCLSVLAPFCYLILLFRFFINILLVVGACVLAYSCLMICGKIGYCSHPDPEFVFATYCPPSFPFGLCVVLITPPELRNGSSFSLSIQLFGCSWMVLSRFFPSMQFSFTPFPINNPSNPPLPP